MTDDRSTEEARRALARSLQARVDQCGYDELLLVDALMMPLERRRLIAGDIAIARPDTLPDDLAVATLAARVARRAADRERRIAALEDDEMPVYAEARR